VHSRNHAATASQCSAPHASITNPAPPRNSDESPNPSFYVSEKPKKTRSPEREWDAHRQDSEKGSDDRCSFYTPFARDNGNPGVWRLNRPRNCTWERERGRERGLRQFLYSFCERQWWSESLRQDQTKKSHVRELEERGVRTEAISLRETMVIWECLRQKRTEIMWESDRGGE